MFSRKSLLLISILLCPITASAWWNGDWSSRKKVTIDASVTGSDLKEALTDVPVLVRLHNGNFGYFSEMAEDGKDVRAMKDDKTPLKFQIEKFDAVNEMALVWVKYPVVQSGSASEDFSLYYGNDDAPPPDGGAGTFNDDFAAVFHFDEKKPLLQDYTAYGNNAEGAGATADNQGESFTCSGSIERLYVHRVGQGRSGARPISSFRRSRWREQLWVVVGRRQACRSHYHEWRVRRDGTCRSGSSRAMASRWSDRPF